jgi:hypothetical protein
VEDDQRRAARDRLDRRRARWTCACLSRSTVHDPRGYAPKVVGKRLAPRLSSLDGKTVYLVDCLFDNTDVFIEQLRQWFAEHLPAVNIRIARPEKRGPTTRRCGRRSRRTATPQSWASVFEAPVARRSSGSPWDWKGDGVPSVAVHTHVFKRLCNATALAMGMPRLRQAYVPQPVVDRSLPTFAPTSKVRIRQRIDRSLHAVLEGLCSPLEEADLQGLSFERTTPRLVEPAAEDDLHQLFEENRWTDSLPVVLPTEARVEAMLKGTSHAPDESSASSVQRRCASGGNSRWKRCVNAVMAGARPRVLPGASSRSRRAASRRDPAARIRSPRSRSINGPIAKSWR